MDTISQVPPPDSGNKPSNSQQPPNAQKKPNPDGNTNWPSYQDKSSTTIDNKLSELPKDHFVSRNGLEYAGSHLILDFWGAKHLDDIQHIETALKAAINAANATLLHIHLHHFSDSGGVSGVAVLAESHISIHTWPERLYIALDVFMCGNAQPEKTIPVLKAAFQPEKINISEQRRGIVDNEIT